jgi:Cdc6-like AAA superfamily ATPase
MKWINCLGSKPVKHVLILMQCSSNSEEVLLSLYEWPGLKNSRLVLVGIANTLDLGAKLAARLNSQESMFTRCIFTLFDFF